METYIYEAHNQNVSSNCLSPTRVQTLPSDLTYPKRYIYIMVLCLVLGEEVTDRFIFDISVEMWTSMKISHLRDGIKEKASLSVPAHKIKLWKVAIPTKDMNDEKMKILINKSHESINVKEELGGELLDAEDSISSKIENVPADNHIHIIVEPPSSPATTGKRKAENFYGRSQSDKREKREYPEETSNGRDRFMVLSVERKEIFTNYMENNRIGLLRSPPSSGKSTIGEYFRDYYNGIYISLSGIYDERKPTIKREEFDTFWKNKLDCTWEEISNCTEKTYLFVDEVQFIYGTYHPTLADNPTPIQITNTLGLNELLLTRNEFNLLVANIVQKYNDRSYFNIPNDVRDTIFNITNGHPGLCRFIMNWLHDHFREGTKSTSTAEILRSLASSSLRSSIVSTSRAFYWADGWSPNEKEADFIRTLLFICRDNEFYPVDLDSNSGVAKKFIKSGIIATDSTNGRMKFSAPITRIVLSHRLFTSSLANSPTTNFEDFLTRTIERFCPTKLANSLGKGKGNDSNLFERTWQMEWYRSATTVVPIGATISADVGPGDKLQEHANRFLTNGIYSDIPLNQWAVLDFRCHSKEVRDPKHNFWYVCYSDDYRRFTIKRRGQADKILSLQGDNI
ncbi:unnamed protein product [Rhizophagus irregularis]|nr:unnamed protein product [Rhizophagus irregularis]